MTSLKIGIAGAGIGGLTAAAALARDGHDVIVFDQFSEPKPVGSGLVIQPVGQTVLARIGASEAAHRLGQPVHHMLGVEAKSGRTILDVKYDLSGTCQRFGLAIHRAALHHSILDAATTVGVKIVQGQKVKAVSAGPKRQILFEDNTATGPFDLVIDATGAGSPLSPLQARPLPYGAVWGTVDWPDETPLPQNQLTQRYRAARRMAGVMPVGYLPGDNKPKAAIFWSLSQAGLPNWPTTPLDQWKAEARALWPEYSPFLQGITQHEHLTTAFYTHGTLRRPVAEGLVHIGDAAHRASPHLGQGANMALLDAWALSLSLRNTTDITPALEDYLRLRRRHLYIYQWLSAVFTPLYQSDGRILPFLRDHLLTPLSHIPPMPAMLGRLVCGDLVSPMKGGLFTSG